VIVHNNNSVSMTSIYFDELDCSRALTKLGDGKDDDDDLESE
jgi:hypothetical protein